jgi:hypothetical protein
MGEKRSGLSWAPAAIVAGAFLAAACGAFASSGDESPAVADAGNTNEDASTDGGDVGPDGASRTDAIAPVAKCDGSKPFGSVLVVQSTQPLLSARLGVDELLYVSRVTEDLGTTKFIDGGIDFVAPILTPANTDEQAMLSHDDTFLVFQSSHRGVVDGLWTLFYSVRSPTGALLSPAVLLFDAASAVGPTEEVQHPWLTASGRIYFTRASATGKVKRIQVGELAMPPTITGAHDVFVAATPDVEHPVLSSDELELFYVASGRIARAARSDANAPFSAGTEVPELSTLTDLKPTWISRDDCDLYLVGVSAAGSGLHRYSRR